MKNMIELARILDQYTDEEIMEARVLTKGLEIIKDRLISSMGGWNMPEFEPIKGLERKIVEKIIKKSKIALHTKEDWANLNKETKDKKFCMMSFLDRDLVDHQGNIVLRVGEICEGDWFFKKQSIIKPLSGLFTVLTVY